MFTKWGFYQTYEDNLFPKNISMHNQDQDGDFALFWTSIGAQISLLFWLKSAEDSCSQCGVIGRTVEWTDCGTNPFSLGIISSSSVSNKHKHHPQSHCSSIGGAYQAERSVQCTTHCFHSNSKSRVSKTFSNYQLFLDIWLWVITLKFWDPCIYSKFTCALVHEYLLCPDE